MRLKTIYSIILLTALAVFFSCKGKEEDAINSFQKGERLLNDENKLNESYEELLHSLSLQDEDHPTKMLTLTYFYISRIYWEQDFNDKSLAYALKALDSDQRSGDSLRAKVLNRVASCYYLLGSHDSAYFYYNKVLDLAMAKNDSVMVQNAYNNIGALKISEKKEEEAIAFFEKGQPYSRHRDKDEATYHYNLSRCYQNMQRWDECAKEICLSMKYQKSTDVEAMEKLYRRLYSVEKNRSNLIAACNAADSTFLLADSLFVLKNREEMKNITEKYQQEKYETELALQRSHWILVLFVIVTLFVVAFTLMMYRNKKRLENLQKNSDNLKIQVLREEQKRDNIEDSEWDAEQEENLSQLYLEQFKVSRDIFRTRPAYNKIRQLIYHTDKNYLSDEERLPLIDSVLEVFIDQLQKLRVNYPELTEDECLYSVLIFVGCNNATASMLTKTTEATLRKRRSRFKQKTNEQVFNLLFG